MEAGLKSMERVVWRWHHHLICIVVIVPLFPENDPSSPSLIVLCQCGKQEVK